MKDEVEAEQELEWIERETLLGGPGKAGKEGWEDQVAERVRRRGDGEPLQYILGESPRRSAHALAPRILTVPRAG